MTTRESILEALAQMLAGAGGFFPPAVIDEPEPTSWAPVAWPGLAALPGSPGLLHAVGVQDGPPPDHLAFLRGGEDAALDELELEAAVAYAVRADLGAGQLPDEARRARRARRDEGVQILAELVARDRTLGLGCEVWAELAPAQREDDIGFANAPAVATFVVPVRVLYTGRHAAA